jgi:hypothetical protein
LESQCHNLAFESRTLRSLSHDPAEEIDAMVAKDIADLNKKLIILHPMQSAHGEQTKPLAALLGSGLGCRPGKHAIDSKTLHDDLV